MALCMNDRNTYHCNLTGYENTDSVTNSICKIIFFLSSWQLCDNMSTHFLLTGSVDLNFQMLVWLLTSLFSCSRIRLCALFFNCQVIVSTITVTISDVYGNFIKYSCSRIDLCNRIIFHQDKNNLVIIGGS